jgi:hypothetical protein
MNYFHRREEKRFCIRRAAKRKVKYWEIIADLEQVRLALGLRRCDQCGGAHNLRL